MDLGADGFRVDVALGLMKDLTYPDIDDPEGLTLAMRMDLDDGSEEAMARRRKVANSAVLDRDEVQDVYREWRALMDTYEGDRMAVAEAWVPPERAARYVAPDTLHQIFNFDFMAVPWDLGGCAASSRRRWPAWPSSGPADLGAVQPRHPPGRVAARRWGAGPAPGPGDGAHRARAARRRLRLPGRGARAGRRDHARRGSAGPGLLPHRREAKGARRRTSADAVVGCACRRTDSATWPPPRGCRSPRGGPVSRWIGRSADRGQRAAAVRGDAAAAARPPGLVDQGRCQLRESAGRGRWTSSVAANCTAS